MWAILLALISFAVSMIAVVTPIVKLNGTITKLDTTITLLNRTVKTNEDNNRAAHKEFYSRLDTLDKNQTEIKTKINIYHEQ